MSGELREAARLMRESAQYAPGGVWSADGYGEVVSGRTEPDADDHLSSYYSDRTICLVSDDDFADEDDANRMAQYLASWHPGMAFLVSRLLVETADGIAARGVTARLKPAEHAAIAVARAYLNQPGG